MELVIKGKNMEVEPQVRGYVERKIGKLDRHLPGVTEAEVVLAMQSTKSPKDRYVVQVTLSSKGTLLRGEERAADLYAAIDSVSNVLDRQIAHYKGKLYHKGRGTSAVRGGLIGGEAEQPRRVVKVKRFMVKPMSPEEAAEQMELLGHDFFLFFNPDSDIYNVIYRREDGDYGLIEPELA